MINHPLVEGPTPGTPIEPKGDTLPLECAHNDRRAGISERRIDFVFLRIVKSRHGIQA